MKKILILDDNFEICLLYKTLVSHMGMAVRTTTDALEALDWLDHDYFDLIMTDMRMPIMGGAEFIRLARAKGVKSKVVAITAFQNLSNANQLAHLNVFACLIKPVLLTKLEEVICAALAEAEAESANGNNCSNNNNGHANPAPAAAAPAPALAAAGAALVPNENSLADDARKSVPENRVGFRTNRQVTVTTPLRFGNRLTLRP
ncbi:MAG: response regulator [Verrucomicrobia bacterium]|nr:response regulator [Verrucomicrobiota bacterium]MBV9657256.1 response regulator [Verrucomicrobiota bacterium]